MGVTVLAGALVAMLLVAAASTGSVQYVERAPSLPGGSDDSAATTTTTTLPPERPGGAEEFKVPDIVPNILEMAIVAGALALVVFTVRHLWRIRVDLQWRRTRRRPDFDVLDDVAAAIRQDAVAQYEALRTGTPRNAIVACWLRLESAVVAAGYRRDPADTSEELTHRVLADFAVDRHAIAELAALYREARFSLHDMDESARQQAIRSLERVHDGLRARAARTTTDGAPNPSGAAT